MFKSLTQSRIAQGLQYAASEIAENGGSKHWRSRRINARINGPLQQRKHADDGIDVPGADWDTLIVVDGCRRDLFEETADISRFDEYRSVTSKASATKEWCQKNWTGDHPDTVYVTGNPVVSREAPGQFNELREVWRDNFDPVENTILASAVTEAALDAHRQHPNKRLVVHYVQPHYPFIAHPELTFASWGNTPEINAPERTGGPHNVWAALCDGHCDRDRVWNAYQDNLAYVLKDVWRLVDALDGRTVVTSDHGNAIGERASPVPVRTYGHPPYLRMESLVDVPWAVVESGRREVVEGTATSTGEEYASAEVSQQLNALGYA